MSPLTALYADFFADPLYYIGIIFALWAAMGFGLFVAGFFDGMPHLFTFGENDTHLEHARDRIIMGLFLSMTAFGAWEIVRFIAGEVPWQYLILSLFMLTPFWIPLVFGKKGGAH
jgi:hypothetical protein